MRFWTAAALVLATSLRVTAAEAPDVAVPTDLGPLLEPIIARHGIPGIAAVALRGDRIVAQGVAGVRKAGTTERITLADKFHLGSDTKAMTATLIARLVEDGKLEWEKPLPAIFRTPGHDFHPAWDEVTLAHVLAHRAGLAPNVPFLRAVRWAGSSEPLPVQRANIVDATLASAPAEKPGAKMIYSNLGFIVAGAAAEKATGRAWEDLMREMIFQPLGLSSAGFGAPGTPGKIDQPWGHSSATKAVAPNGLTADNPPFLGPAGTVHMSITDWAAFVALHLQGHAANPNRRVRLLRAESFERLHSPFPADTGDYFGGWVITTLKWANGGRAGDTGRVLWHNGSNTKWYSITWLAPERDFALLITCNRGDDSIGKSIEDAVQAVIQAVLSKEPKQPAAK